MTFTKDFFANYGKENVKCISTMTSQTLGVNDQRVEIRPATQTNITLTLPSVKEAAGRFYSIHLLSLSTANTITIADQDDSLDWTDISNMDAASDSVLLYADGLRWFVVDNQIA